MNEYKVKLMITMPNKSSNLVRLMQVFKDMDVSIDHMSVANHMKDHFTITIETFHQNPTKISYLLKDLKKMNSFIT